MAPSFPRRCSSAGACSVAPACCPRAQTPAASPPTLTCWAGHCQTRTLPRCQRCRSRCGGLCAQTHMSGQQDPAPCHPSCKTRCIGDLCANSPRGPRNNYKPPPPTPFRAMPLLACSAACWRAGSSSTPYGDLGGALRSCGTNELQPSSAFKCSRLTLNAGPPGGLTPAHAPRGCAVVQWLWTSYDTQHACW